MSLINFSLDHRMVAPERGNFLVKDIRKRPRTSCFVSSPTLFEKFRPRNRRSVVLFVGPKSRAKRRRNAHESSKELRAISEISCHLKLAYVIKYPRYYKMEYSVIKITDYLNDTALSVTGHSVFQRSDLERQTDRSCPI